VPAEIHVYCTMAVKALGELVNRRLQVAGY